MNITSNDNLAVKDKAEGKLTPDDIMTGSTSAAIMGHNPFMTANDCLQTAMDAVNNKPRKELTFEALHWGTQFEIDIIKEACRRLKLGKYWTQFSRGFSSDDAPMAVSLDATAQGEDQVLTSNYQDNIVCYSDKIKLSGRGIIEAKLTSHESELELPMYRGRVQLQMAMDIMDCDWGVVAVLHRGIKLVLHVFYRDKELIENIRIAAIDFDRRVQKYKNHQEVEWYDFTTPKSAAKVFDEATDDTVDLSDMENDIQTIQETRQDIKDLQEIHDVTTARVMARMGDAKYGKAGNYHITWGEINYKAKPETLVPAKEARTIRVNKLKVKVNV